MTIRIKKQVHKRRKGSALAMVVLIALILSILGIGLMQIAMGVRYQAIKMQNGASALLAAQAGYEQATIWMGWQPDLRTSLDVIINNAGGSSNFGSVNGVSDNGGATYTYDIVPYNRINFHPVYRLTSHGQRGRDKKTIDVLVVQDIENISWEMDACRVPNSPWTTNPVFFNDGDYIDMPMHINSYGGLKDMFRDIFINGAPLFLRQVTIGESKTSRRGNVKYSDKLIKDSFKGGIYFEQPNRQTDHKASLAAKVNRFRFKNNTSPMTLNPVAAPGVSNVSGAVQLEFFVNGLGVGQVKITNNCTVALQTPGAWDYKIGTGSTPYQKYNLYGYHYAATGNLGITTNISNTYVTEVFGGRFTSPPGGKIFVNGDVIIGGAQASEIKGKLTVVATGNIWIVNSVRVADNGYARQANGMPHPDNPNVLGLVSRDGVVKVIDPGLSSLNGGPTIPVVGYDYRPVALQDPAPGSGIFDRRLYIGDNKVVVEASIISGGGGWGMENVGQRKDEAEGISANLFLRGSLYEAFRGMIGANYARNYYLDDRLSDGILPGDIWLSTKYIPVPGGWTEN